MGPFDSLKKEIRTRKRTWSLKLKDCRGKLTNLNFVILV